jgi:hypothetical protein
MTGRPDMRTFAKTAYIMSLLAVVMAAGMASAQTSPQLEVVVSLSQETISLDEQAVLEVEVKGAAQDMPTPSLPTLPMFEIYSQGRSTSISYVNGVVEASVTNRYLLVPTKPGTYPIENISVVYQNRRYVGNAVTLTVVSSGTPVSPQLEQRALDTAGNSKDYFLEASIDNRNPYVSQQVTLTLKLFIAVQYYGSPELVEPTTTGFWTELLGTRGPYQQRVNNRTYRVIERKYALFPTATGEQTIGRATITVTVQSRQQSRRRDPFDIFGMLGAGEEVQIRSQPLTLSVKPLPSEGRPSDFSGTVGRFTLKATPTKREVEVNQPVSVNFLINGLGNIKSVAEPVIPDLPDFRVYKASSNESVTKVDDRLGGTKTIEEVFIPNRPGQLVIPAVSFSYFDPEASQYRMARTAPISLNVIRSEGYAAAPEMPYSAPDLRIGADARDIRYIKGDPGDLGPREGLLLTSPLYLTVNAAPVLALMVTVLMRRRREKLSGNIGYARSRRASREARRRLARARQLARVNDAEQFFGESSQALLSFIGDKLNVSPHGLTSDRIRELLDNHSADRQLVQDILTFLDHCSFARYAPASVSQADIDQSLAEAEKLMMRLEEVRF